MKQTGKINRFLTLPVLVGGVVIFAIALCTRLSVGTPYVVLHKLGVLDILPPVWLVGLIWSLLYVLAGAVSGYLLSCPLRNAVKETFLWRGCTFMVSSFVLSLAWYALLFGKFWLLPSWICLCFGCVCAVFCAISWWKISKTPAMLIGVFALWEISIIFMQFLIMIST